MSKNPVLQLFSPYGSLYPESYRCTDVHTKSKVKQRMTDGTMRFFCGVKIKTQANDVRPLTPSDLKFALFQNIKSKC